MTYQDNHITNYNKDCRTMRELPDGSIQCVVTSPPYWGLRKYAGDQDLVWNSGNGCHHEWVDSSWVNPNSSGGQGYKQDTVRGSSFTEYNNRSIYSNTCRLCGAWRGAYGLEPSPEMYVQHTIEILREVRRVLRKDGVVFWNIGDSYAGSGMGAANYPGDYPKQNSNIGILDVTGRKQYKDDVIKPKDLCLIPFRVAIAAQEDGWYIRSIIIWNKLNPMPEPVRDRPTEAHEYILLLTKSSKYYWDQEAVREPITEATIQRNNYPHNGGGPYQNNRPRVPGEFGNESGRNLRSVWTFSTQPYPEAHFATFPEELPERCIKAGTPEYGCCDKCGMPYERILEKGLTEHDGVTNGKSGPRESTGRLAQLRQAARERGSEYINETKTLGWQQVCKCQDSKTVPSIVLDPFAGSGTTLWVAKKLGRKAVGYEISEEYCRLIVERNRQQVLV